MMSFMESERVILCHSFGVQIHWQPCML